MSSYEHEERREYYRIEDRVALEILPAEDTGRQLSPLFELLGNLHQLELEAQPLLRQIADGDRALASYLRLQDRRIELIGQVLSHTVLQEMPPPQTVLLSEGGIQFAYPEPLPNDLTIHLKLLLLPESLGLLLSARILSCQSKTHDTYEVIASFESLSDVQRQLLARHILQRQAQERRQAQARQGADKPLVAKETP